MHKILERINLAIKRVEKIPSAGEIFENEWNSGNDVKIRLKKGETYENLKEKAEILSEKYLESEWEPKYPVMTEKKFSIKLFEGLPKVMGVLDSVEESENGFMLTDFKTSSRKRSPKMQQLVLYKLALKHLGYQPKKVDTRYLVFTKTKNPDIYEYKMEITRTHFDKLERVYRSVYEDIKKGCSFPIISWKCHGCRFKKYCDAV